MVLSLYKDKLGSEEQLPRLIIKLKEHIQDDKKLIKCRLDDEFLTKFLRVRGYDVKRALSGLRKYYRNVERNQDIIVNLKPNQFVSVFDANITFILKHRDKVGCKVGICRPGVWDTTKFTIRDIQLASVFLAEEAIQEKETQLNGVSVIFDMKDLSLQHIRQLSTTELRRIIFTAQEGLPLKVSSVHFINYPSIFWAVYYVVQGFLKEKIRQRTHLHSSLESLQEYFNPEHLPKSLGGTLDIEDAVDKQILARLLERNRYYEEYYSNNEAIRTDDNSITSLNFQPEVHST